MSWSNLIPWIAQMLHPRQHSTGGPTVYGQQILPPVGQCWPTGRFWLYNQQFSDVRPTVAFQPIFMSVEFATGGSLVDQWHFLFKMAVNNNRIIFGNLVKIYS